MGITGLFNLVRPVFEKTSLSQLVGVLGIYASYLAHNFASTHAIEIVMENNFQPFLLDVYASIQRPQSYGLGTFRVFMVFDGYRDREKKVNEERAAKRKSAMEVIDVHIKTFHRLSGKQLALTNLKLVRKLFHSSIWTWLRC
ncbi:hypothetical protein SARC_05695 [Sphaeroforma arctica JP610]|uniref:Uncharacterized protein n=1 Tax=Sphaeroforma arctica JP610 TaxID=667725 RepID=A0A0L0FYT9_9EUKA|nr:hypothetical protein SARC_05695 [Sphaeroforma arctica JP610]KNC82012.1 hypothetical protein SARC_05695 [Sphaeroforma arctica JP610]|eukprot:XP_014155914.1 hypothetical protein SARC_05695 [Sphaeroforma arctica JP610]